MGKCGGSLYIDSELKIAESLAGNCEAVAVACMASIQGDVAY